MKVRLNAEEAPTGLQGPRKLDWALMAVSMLVAASMWFYVDAILVRFQVADAAAHSRPRGNLSDLYPRWLGARELLLHGRNPYSHEITTEIQRGYYGRPLNPSLSGDPKDQQAFAYPVYVAFVLAPAIGLPFAQVQIYFRWTLLVLSVASVWWWLKALRWRLAAFDGIVCCVLLLGSFPAVQGLKLQQLTLLVAPLLAAASALLQAQSLFMAGVVLALATIKPQLAAPLTAWLMLWTALKWKNRWRFAAGFCATLGILAGASEIVLPGWFRLFRQALREYRVYTENHSVLDQLTNWVLGPWGGSFLAIICVLLATAVLWDVGKNPGTGDNLGRSLALIMALTVLVIPMNAPYNQVLLLPSVLSLVKDRKQLTCESMTMQLLYFLGVTAIAWEWITSLALTIVWCASSRTALAGWKLPLYPTFSIPPLLFALSLVNLRRHARLRARADTE